MPLLDRRQVLSFEELADVARLAAGMGVRKVRLTGGEPLVRKGLTQLVRMLAEIPGLYTLAMTTNGLLLSEHAEELARAGLDRVNISLDAVDAGRYAELTHGGDVRRVFEGIASAKDAGLTPIKVNCVVRESSEEADARDVARFCSENGLEARFIREMDLRRGKFSIVEGGSGGDCGRCNRLRLTSNGDIRPCLFSDLAFNVRVLGAAEAIRAALGAKPEAGSACENHWFRAIGG